MKTSQSANIPFRQFRQYGWLSFLVVCLIAGLTLWLAGQPNTLPIILSLACFISLIPVIVQMIRAVMQGKLGVDIIAVVAVISAVLMGEYWAGLVIMLMLTGGQALEDYAQSRARQELVDLLRRSPKIAHLVQKTGAKDIPVERIRPQDILLIKPGETIPVDGIVTVGDSSLDESALTGESLPIAVGPGSAVLSGAINSDTVLKIRATHTSHDSQYEQIIRLVQEAASSHSPLVRLADQYSVPFTIITFTIAGITWIATGQALRGLEVLVVATPCPLLIATPVAIVAGMSRAARDGIIIKNGSALETLARLRTIAFDKTGTLTRSHPTITTIQAYGLSQPKLLQIAASLEADSPHILARAIVASAHKNKVKLLPANHVVESPGLGLSGTVKDHKVLTGSYLFMEQRSVKGLTQVKSIRQSDIIVGIDGRLAGIISFGDAIRPETRSTLADLKTLGIERILMLTGDQADSAHAIADQVGITDIHAQCLPQDKLRVVKHLPADDLPVGMVGDGINDAPTLAAADVGIALGAKGSTAASESAGVVIMLDDLARVPKAIRIAQRTIQIARQSILVGIGLSTALMLIAAIGGIRPVYGALLQEGLDVAVILNALRARK